MSRIYLIPGLGADCRIYKHIHLDEHEVIHVNWIEPLLNDTLTTYAQKLISQYNILENSILIGNSMGGMVAIEIARQIKVSKTIIISSIKSSAEAPWYFSLFRNVPVYKLIPGRLLNSMGFMIKPVFGHMAIDDAALFRDMLEHSSPVFIKWAMGAILHWTSMDIPANTYHITGDKDLLFPYKNIPNASIVKGGTHIMIFDKADEINKLLKEILQK